MSEDTADIRRLARDVTTAYDAADAAAEALKTAIANQPQPEPQPEGEE